MNTYQSHYSSYRLKLIAIFISAFPAFIEAAECTSTFPEFSPHQDTYGVACSKLPDGGTFSFRITTPPTNGMVVRFTTLNDDELLYLSRNFLPDTIGYEVLTGDSAIIEAGTTFISLESVTKSTDDSSGVDTGNECPPSDNQGNTNLRISAAAVIPNCGSE